MNRFTLLSVAVMAAVVAASTLSVSTSRAALISYEALLNGASESPPNASPGTGLAFVDYDNTLHTLRVQASFSGLLGTTTSSHIHGATATAGSGTAGVATQTPSFALFPSGVTAGFFDQTLDLTLASSFNASYIAANGGTPASAETALASGIAAGKAYLNIHSTAFGGGEIRGFLVPVPEPSTLLLGAMGILGLLVVAGKCRKTAVAS